MRFTLRKTIALLGLAALLSSCGDARIPDDTLPRDTEPPAITEADATVPATEPTVTTPPEAEVQVTIPPETEAPITTAPDTESPATLPPETEAPITATPETIPPETEIPGFTEIATINPGEIENEADAIKDSPAIVIQIPELLQATAPGHAKKDSGSAVIDYSNITDGYVTVKYKHKTSTRIKVQIKGPKTTYTYNITPEELTVFPLSEGNGKYTVTVYENVTGTKYATVISTSFNANLKNEFGPFLYPNQYVDYSRAPNSVNKAYELTAGTTDPLKMVAAIYDYVVDTLTYDSGKAATVKSGYLPELDKVLETKTGICFDYAALMTGMLRSLGIPCKLVVGYAGDSYHAWINVWSESEGWIDGAIFFNGTSWQRMDPTFASSAHRSQGIMEYIGDGKNYTEKYLY